MRDLEDLVKEEMKGRCIPELGTKILLLHLIKLGKEYLSMFEQKMAMSEDETELLILQSQYNVIYDFFGKYLTDENY